MWFVLEDSKRDGSSVMAFEVTEGSFEIGRGPACQVWLPSQSVSRRHAKVECNAGKIVLADLGSNKGTLVNGSKISEVELAIGDKLSIGPFVLRLEEQRPKTELPSLSFLPTTSGGIDWQAFREFLSPVTEATTPRELLEKLLQGLATLIGAKRGFVLLREGQAKELVTVASHGVADGVDEFVAVSSTVYKRVIKEMDVLFIANSHEDERSRGAKSIADQEWPHSILCAPIISSGKAIGVVYVDMPLSGDPVGNNETELMRTVTFLASLLLNASQTRKALFAARGVLAAIRAQSDEGFVLGESPESKELDKLLQAAAPKDVSVLITGETGTGKEMVARAIHDLSSRKNGPFVPVNCAALPRDIIEAELFGAEKGAYTGADERRIGRFELANGGTLFIDELGELPLDFQIKLLRVLQERQITRLGSGETIPVDFRLISATNVNLEEAVREGTFRQDFYYRVNVFRIELKPLRERPDDILPLANHFLAHFKNKYGAKIEGFSSEADRLLRSHSWVGNIRELRNAIERAVVIETSNAVTPESLPIDVNSAGTDNSPGFWTELPHDWERAREVFECTFLERGLERHKGNISELAKVTGMPRSTIYRRLTKYGLVDKK